MTAALDSNRGPALSATRPPGDYSWVLQVQDLSWGYHATTMLGSELNLQVSPGEAIAVVGPNGAGKTALLKTLGGLIPPITGKIFFQGSLSTHLSPLERARCVAALPQDISEDEGLTVCELVELGRTPYLGLWGSLRATDHQVVKEALSLCHLDSLAHRPLNKLSGGERQRARLALAVAQNTPLLLLDEPSNHLDLQRRYELFELLAHLRDQRALAIVMVLHDLVEAYKEAQRVYVLTQGRASELPAQAPDRVQRLAQAFGVPVDRIHL